MGRKSTHFISLLGTIFVLYYQFYKWNVSVVIVGVLSVLLITSERITLSAMLGLETGLYALLLIALFRAADSRGSHRSSALALGVIGVLLYLTLPETIALLLLLAVGLFVFKPYEKSRLALIPIPFWIIGLLLVTAWRLDVFGDFIPNSTSAKSIISLSALQISLLWSRTVAGARYTYEWLRASWLMVILGIVGVIYL